MDINRNNYETYFLSYLDKELTPVEQQGVEKFLTENTDLQKEFSLLQMTVFSPADIVFESREVLFRRDEKRRIMPLYWMRMAAAIALLLFGTWFIISQRSSQPSRLNTADHALALIQKEVHPALENTVVPEAETQPGKKKTQGMVIPSRRSPVPEKNQGNPVVRPAQTVSDTEEPGIIAEKSKARLEIQRTGLPSPGATPKNMELSGAAAPSLVLTASAAGDRIAYENVQAKESEVTNDNAISVIALNEENKGITGFFKKLTKRTPVDEKARTVHVAVFQFSY